MSSLSHSSKSVEWWQRVEELFIATQALQRHEWHRALTAACADDSELAYEVLSLLVAGESLAIAEIADEGSQRTARTAD